MIFYRFYSDVCIFSGGICAISIGWKFAEQQQPWAHSWRKKTTLLVGGWRCEISRGGKSDLSRKFLVKTHFRWGDRMPKGFVAPTKNESKEERRMSEETLRVWKMGTSASGNVLLTNYVPYINRAQCSLRNIWNIIEI